MLDHSGNIFKRFTWVVTHYATSGWRILRQVIKTDVVDYYDFIGTDLVNFLGSDFQDIHKPLWLNLGLWDHASSYDNACADLARLLGQAAELSRGDSVLDVGFGFAAQDVLFLDEFKVTVVSGINISPMQVGFAQKRMAGLGLSDRVSLAIGSATSIDFPTSCFDKVVSLEAACHFDTREKFFGEAFRVLKPGGRIALTDLIPLPNQQTPGLVARLERRFNAFPEANLYGRDVYGEKLRSAGFEDVSVVSIRERVFPGMAKFMRLRKQGVLAENIFVTLTPEDQQTCKGAEIWAGQGVGDYVIASARKP